MELTRNFPSDSEASIENPYTLTKSGTATLNISFKKKAATLNMLCPVQMNRLFLYRACKSLNMEITLFYEFNKICLNRATAGKRDIW